MLLPTWLSHQSTPLLSSPFLTSPADPITLTPPLAEAAVSTSLEGGYPGIQLSPPTQPLLPLRGRWPSSSVVFFSHMNSPPWCMDVFSHLSHLYTRGVKYRILPLPSSEWLLLPLLVSATWVPFCRPWLLIHQNPGDSPRTPSNIHPSGSISAAFPLPPQPSPPGPPENSGPESVAQHLETC